MKIFHYIETLRLDHGGVSRAVLDMASVMAAGGHEVSLQTPDTENLPNELIADSNLRVLAASERNLFRAGSVLEQAIDEVDVVHLHTPWCLSNLKIARLARRLGKPYVVTVHGMLDDWSMSQKALKKKIYLKLFGTQFLENASYVQCTARAEMEQSRIWYPSGKPIVLPYIFDTTPFKDLPGIGLANTQFPELALDEMKILFLSRIHPKKGIEHLLDAVAHVCDSGMPVRLFVTGPEEKKYQQELKQRASALGISDIVKFTGPLYGDRKLSMYQSCDLFVLPTSQENFGIVLTESLAAGTPVITTRGTDIWEEIRDAGGRIVEQDGLAIAEELNAIGGNSEKLIELGQIGRKWVLDRFEPNRMRADYERMYNGALDLVMRQ